MASSVALKAKTKARVTLSSAPSKTTQIDKISALPQRTAKSCRTSRLGIKVCNVICAMDPLPPIKLSGQTASKVSGLKKMT